MTYLRLLRMLDWIARILMRLPYKDRWGFNFGEDLDVWLLLQKMAYADRVQRATGLIPVEAVARRPCGNGYHSGHNLMILWPDVYNRGLPPMSCENCGPSTYATGAVVIDRETS